jgi:hypothetical protein
METVPGYISECCGAPIEQQAIHDRHGVEIPGCSRFCTKCWRGVYSMKPKENGGYINLGGDE